MPPVVKSAASVLVVGSLARKSTIEHGADPARVRIFANTIDVSAFEERADRLAARRPELARRSASPETTSPACASPASRRRRGSARYSPRSTPRPIGASSRCWSAKARSGRGSSRSRASSASERSSPGPRPGTGIAEVYVASDVFALLSQHEPWGVVVNEAAACGLPLVLSERVGAAHDLLRSAENGVLVEAGDVEATAAALSRLAADADLRLRMGARSRALVEGWSYGPSVEAFVTAVREASASR